MSEKALISGVTKDPSIFDGEPVLTDTKTPVRAIIEMRRLYYTVEEINARLPHLDAAQIQTAIDYYAANRAEIDPYIESNRVPHYLIESLNRKS